MTYIKSRLELNIINVLGDIEIHADNAVRNLDSGTRIDVKDIKATIEELLDRLMDYHDQYQLITNKREIKCIKKLQKKN
jgi:hypothetical protein